MKMLLFIIALIIIFLRLFLSTIPIMIMGIVQIHCIKIFLALPLLKFLIKSKLFDILFFMTILLSILFFSGILISLIKMNKKK
jgi:hypothetical protein